MQLIDITHTGKECLNKALLPEFFAPEDRVDPMIPSVHKGHELIHGGFGGDAELFNEIASDLRCTATALARPT